MNRRQFLKRLGFTSLISLMPIFPFGTMSTSWAALGENDSPNKPRLIVVFLRGAVDGLNVVIPYGDQEYYTYRPTIAIPRPGLSDGVLDLDTHFGLHPALSDLMPLWKEKSLAFVHASGSPDPNRSHFEAQDNMETAMLGHTSNADGWMNRLVGILPGSKDPIRAVSFGETIPRILSGSQLVSNLPLGRNATNQLPIDRTDLEGVFDNFYTGNDILSREYHQGIQARKQLVADLTEETKMANNGAPPPNGFPHDAQQLAGLIKQEPRVEIAFLALGGWDTHINQGNANGQLANHLKDLGSGLSTLTTGLGEAYSNTMIVVMSEFGRTPHENDNAGTDHGHGNVMWVMGGPVKGGKVYGKWPGLSQENLYQGRDLAITTDFRAVLSNTLSHQFKLNAVQLNHIFPNFTPAPTTIQGLI